MRMLVIALTQSRYVVCHHAALAFVQVPSVQVETQHVADRVETFNIAAASVWEVCKFADLSGLCAVKPAAYQPLAAEKLRQLAQFYPVYLP